MTVTGARASHSGILGCFFCPTVHEQVEHLPHRPREALHRGADARQRGGARARDPRAAGAPARRRQGGRCRAHAAGQGRQTVQGRQGGLTLSRWGGESNHVLMYPTAHCRQPLPEQTVVVGCAGRGLYARTARHSLITVPLPPLTVVVLVSIV